MPCGGPSLRPLFCAGCAPEIPVPPPVRPDLVLPVETRIVEAIVPRQATLETLLLQHQLPAPLVHAAIESARAVFNPRQLRAERPYRLVLSIDGFLREFEYQIDTDKFLRIVNRDRSTPDKLEAEVLPYDKDVETVAVRGQIDGDHPSLIAAMDATGERIQLAIAFAELFAGQVDFENDLQPGDSFELLFETLDVPGRVCGLRHDRGRAPHQQRPRASRIPLGESRHSERPATTTRTAGR